MTNDRSFYVEQLITGSFVKYSKLVPLIAQSYVNSPATEINLFIDLNSILKQMYSVDSWTYKHRNQFEIAATVINMCGHYREFFRGLSVTTNIYLIYGLNCPTINDTYVKGYNSKFIESYIKKPSVTEIIDQNMKVLNLMCNYLPHIYFFDIGTNEVSAMVDYLINMTKARERGIENLVISKDILMLQLIPEQDARILHPKKTKDGDESYILDNSNMWYHFFTDIRKSKIPNELISNVFIQNILSMTRVPERGLFNIMNITKAFHVIDTGVKTGFLDPTKFYTQSTMNTILQAMGIGINPTELEMRFRAINTHYQSTFVLTLEKPEFKRLRMIDLEDAQSLKDIITNYFTDTPIDLDKL